MPRRRDRITVESAEGVFDRFSSLRVVNDVTSPSEAEFEIGDPSAWNALERLIFPGKPFKVLLNGRPRLTGRAEVNDSPLDAGGGSKLSLTVRTKLSDAFYRSAAVDLKVQGVSIKEFILAAYEPLGFTASDFVFSPETERDLMTGKSPGGGGAPPDLDSPKLEQAKVQPPETIYEVVERHLNRFHAHHWDGPSGKILVGVPDDTQQPSYRFQCLKGSRAKGNNVLSARRLRDWSDVPRKVTVTGDTSGIQSARGKFLGEAIDADVDAVAAATGHFNRDVYISGIEAKSQAHAEAVAARELSARVRRKSAYEVTTDGWSFWNGDEQIPYAHNTVADLDVHVHGAEARGRYLIVRVELEQSAVVGARTKVMAVAPGIWVL